jgi:hypothetical protein
MNDMTYFRLFLILLFSTALTHSAAADPLLDLMGEEAYRAAGLHKLSPEERQNLAEWFGVFVEKEKEVAVEAALPSGESSFGLEQVVEKVGGLFRNSPDVIESRILGEFRGWSGRTTFRLENGQVWQQSAPGEFAYRAKDPVIVIRRGTFGSYLLRVDGKGTTVRVRRIE